MRALYYLLPIPLLMAGYSASCRMSGPGEKPSVTGTESDVRYAICALCVGLILLLVIAAIAKDEGER